ncbi:MAG: hypothetical protein ABIC82_03145 [bacterium]
MEIAVVNYYATSLLNTEEQNKIKIILLKISSGAFGGLDIKKLKGHDNIFRARKGKTRIIYKVDQTNNIYILTIERRSDNTYNF